ncbi:MAG: iron ABC transporter permease [Coriobacteriales bacterium]|nr:iron ABC transporter permease [Coriobacteriales bacterium]
MKNTPVIRRPWITFAVVAAALLVATVAAFIAGASSVQPQDVWALLTGGEISASARSILLNVRLPRVLAALLSGAALAVAGALIQAVLDNPLASPNIIGINSGAGLFVLLAASLFPSLLWLPPLAAFAGALLSALVVFGISMGTSASRLTVILSGIAITAVFGAGINTVLIVSPDAYFSSALFLVGGFTRGIPISDIIWAACLILPALLLSFIISGKLNILALGDQTAHSLGMRVGITRLALLALAALLAGVAVSVAGLLGFVGLIIPHLVRFITGHDNRVVIPLSALGGAFFVIACDTCARLLFYPYELPVGIMMAFLGGPFFVYLIVKNRKRGLDD